MDSFRESMLSDKRIEKIVDFPNPKDCFPNANISGGVCYFLWNKKYDGKCEFTNVVDGQKTTASRCLSEFDIFVRYNNALSIINKVHNIDFTQLGNIVSSRNLYNLSSSIRGEAFKTEKNYITVFSSKGTGYIGEKDFNSNSESWKKYKLFMGKVLSGHIGETDNIAAQQLLAAVRAELDANEIYADTLDAALRQKGRKAKDTAQGRGYKCCLYIIGTFVVSHRVCTKWNSLFYRLNSTMCWNFLLQKM